MATVQIIEDTQAQWQQGTLTGVQATPEGDLVLIDGYTSPALSFDGVDDNLQVTSFGDGNLSNTAGTFYVRVRRADATGLGTAAYQNLILIKTQDVANGRKIGIGLDGSGRAKIYKFDGTHGAWPGTSVITDNQWHHLALVSDGAGNLELYVDGALEVSQAITPFAIDAGRLVWAAYYDAGLAYYAKVDIDEPAVWNVARSQAEIQTDMLGKLQGNESGLVGLWKLNEGTGTTATDATSYARSGTIAGATWITRTIDVTSGNRTSPAYGLSPLIQASSSLIQWSSTEPGGTSITVETRLSTDGGASWGAWQPATNGGTIPGITSELDLRNAVLQIREALQRDTPTTTSPSLHSLTAEVQGTATGTSDLTSSGGVLPTGWLQGSYTVISVGTSDLPSMGIARQHVSLPSAGGVPPVAILESRYAVIRRPEVTTALFPIRDAFVWEKEPTLNYGDTQDLAWGRTISGHLTRSLIRFDLSGLRPDLTIVSAVLRVRLRFGAGGSVGVYPLLGEWEEYGVTWANQPAASPTPATTAQAPDRVGESVDLDITDLFKGWYTGSQANWGVGLRATDELTAPLVLVGAREQADAGWRPQLLVTYYELDATPAVSDLPMAGQVGKAAIHHLLSAGEVSSVKQASQCMSWVTGWYGYYSDLLNEAFAQGWDLPSLCALIRAPGSETCSSQILASGGYTDTIKVSATTRVTVTVVWVTSVDLRYDTYYQADPRYCYCRGTSGSDQVAVFTAFASVENLLGGTCYTTHTGTVSRRDLLHTGFVLQVSSLPTLGSVRGPQVADLASVAATSRRDTPSSGVPRLGAQSDLASTGTPQIPADSDLAASGQVDIGPNSLSTLGTVADQADLPASGYAELAHNDLNTTGTAPAYDNLNTVGSVGQAPNQLPSSGSPRVADDSNLPSQGHASSQWFASRGFVYQVSSLFSLGLVRTSSGIATAGFVTYRAGDDLPSSGFPRIRDASDLPTAGFVGGAQSDLGSRGIVTAVVLELDIDLRAWPPEGRSLFPS